MADDYRSLLQEITGSYFVVQDETFVLVSQGIRKQYGYEVGDLVGRYFLSVIAPEAREQALKIHRARVAGEEVPHQYETTALAKNGTKVPAEALAWPTRYLDRPAVTGVLIDNTESKRRIDELLRARDEERKRLARELHDDTIQGLLVVCQHLRDIDAGTYGELPRSAQDSIARVQAMINQMVREVRNLTEDFRPAILGDMGLVSALRGLAGRLIQQGEMSVNTCVRGQERRLSPDTELALLRIAQEALSNVRRHAAASSVLIVLEFGDQKVRMTVSDNGCGFEVPLTIGHVAQQGKFGLIGIGERVHMLRGSCRIESVLGKGTDVIVEMST
ncbi:MAG: PAS domain-containing sensor histidine kinase [Dehalococcoidia bacterium]